MSIVNRRDFMLTTAGIAGLGATIAKPAHAAPVVSKAGERVALGKSGVTASRLGMGTGTRAWNGSSAQNRQGRQAFVRALAHAYEQGIRYFDLADMYGAHDFMREAIKQTGIPREDLTLLTKTVSQDADGVSADLDRFRKEADTDYFDIVLLHCMTEGGWEKKLNPCTEVLAEAKAKGLVRACGVSCHNLDAMKDAAVSPWVDIMLSRINPFGIKMDGTVEEVVEVLQTAHANGKGMIGMKIAGEGTAVDRLPESLKFVFGLGCIDAVTIGFLNPEEIDDTIEKLEVSVA